MKEKTLLQIPLPQHSKKDILEQIYKYISSSTFGKTEMFHVVSLNPENIVLTTQNQEFKKVVLSAQMTIVDGVGVRVAAQLLGIPVGERVTGVDLMAELVKAVSDRPLQVLLLGGRPNLAKDLAECYQKTYAQNQFTGLEGIKNIKNPTSEEEEKIFSIVRATRPRLILAAFGSPYQEIWFHKHKDQLKGIVCVGVGGAFDFLSGTVKRAPYLVKRLGLEWFFRLILQPWRFKRQLKLLTFMKLVLKQKFSGHADH